jgi:hypothetical protein
MSIPLDSLYHYIQNVAEKIYSDSVIIYRFYPHGSKNINDLNNLTDLNCKDNSKEWLDKTIRPLLWCNDQEPLDYKFYSTQLRVRPENPWMSILKDNNLYVPHTNLNYRRLSVFEKHILLHSEQRSTNLEKYHDDNELIPVYYWSHGVIARDWFRYAEHETFQKKANKTFLIYNRAWSNTREYRLKFADLLIENKLLEHCQTTCNVIDPELDVHYNNHQFKNALWKPNNKLENFLKPTTADSTNSANFQTEDYNSTDIEIVLETLFDDSRLHLTEKSLRPIACGQPFILAGTHGSLEYLRSYGFKTFGHIWDESYDLVNDPESRLIKIANLMRQIANWTPEVRERKMAEARAIAEYNRQRFFSQDFFNQIIDELKTNLISAFNEFDSPKNYRIDYWNKLISNSEIIDFVSTNQEMHLPTKSDLDFVCELVKNKPKNQS